MPLKLVQLLISLEKCFLHGLFGIFRIMSHILGNPEQFSIVSLHELLEGRNISAPDCLNKSQIVVLSVDGLTRITTECPMIKWNSALWHVSLNEIMYNGPITYEVEGQQYLLVAAGAKLFAFTLPQQ